MNRLFLFFRKTVLGSQYPMNVFIFSFELFFVGEHKEKRHAIKTTILAFRCVFNCTVLRTRKFLLRLKRVDCCMGSCCCNSGVTFLIWILTTRKTTTLFINVGTCVHIKGLSAVPNIEVVMQFFKNNHQSCGAWNVYDNFLCAPLVTSSGEAFITCSVQHKIVLLGDKLISKFLPVLHCSEHR